MQLSGFQLFAALAYLYRKEGVPVADVAGVQQVAIKVRGGYDPDVIVIKQGKPVRLQFSQEESSMCSEMDVFDKIGKSTKLPEGEMVNVETMGAHPGMGDDVRARAHVRNSFRAGPWARYSSDWNLFFAQQ